MWFTEIKQMALFFMKGDVKWQMKENADEEKWQVLNSAFIFQI